MHLIGSTLQQYCSDLHEQSVNTVTAKTRQIVVKN